MTREVGVALLELSMMLRRLRTPEFHYGPSRRLHDAMQNSMKNITKLPRSGGEAPNEFVLTGDICQGPDPHPKPDPTSRGFIYSELVELFPREEFLI